MSQQPQVGWSGNMVHLTQYLENKQTLTNLDFAASVQARAEQQLQTLLAYGQICIRSLYLGIYMVSLNVCTMVSVIIRL